MGLLDGFFGAPGQVDPETQKFMLRQGLLGLGAALLKAGGPSRMPMDFGSALGSGLEAGVGAAQNGYGLLGQMQRNKLLGAQVKKLESETAQNSAFDQSIFGPETGQGGQQQPPAPISAAPTPMVPMGPENPLAKAVEWQESRGNPNAVSPKGALGSMQTMPGTLRDPGFGVRPFDPNAPDVNAERRRVGVDYLNTMVQRYQGNTADALVAYNWGPGNAAKWIAGGRDPNALPAETRNYVASITRQLGGGQGQPQQPVRVAQAGGTMNDAAPEPAPIRRLMDIGLTRQQAATASMMRGEALKNYIVKAQQANRVDTLEQEQQKIRVRQAGAPSNTVNVAGQENQFNKEMGTLQAKAIGEWRADATRATSLLQKTEQLKAVLDRGFQTGWGADSIAQVGNILETAGLSPDIANKMFGTRDRTTFNSAARSLVFDVLGSLGTGVSNADRDFIEKVVPNIADPTDATREVIGYLEKRANLQIQKYEKGLAAPDPLKFEVEWNRQFGGAVPAAQPRPQQAAPGQPARQETRTEAPAPGARVGQGAEVKDSATGKNMRAWGGGWYEVNPDGTLGIQLYTADGKPVRRGQ